MARRIAPDEFQRDYAYPFCVGSVRLPYGSCEHGRPDVPALDIGFFLARVSDRTGTRTTRDNERARTRKSGARGRCFGKTKKINSKKRVEIEIGTSESMNRVGVRHRYTTHAGSDRCVCITTVPLCFCFPSTINNHSVCATDDGKGLVARACFSVYESIIHTRIQTRTGPIRFGRATQISCGDSFYFRPGPNICARPRPFRFPDFTPHVPVPRVTLYFRPARRVTTMSIVQGLRVSFYSNAVERLCFTVFLASRNLVARLAEPGSRFRNRGGRGRAGPWVKVNSDVCPGPRVNRRASR